MLLKNCLLWAMIGLGTGTLAVRGAEQGTLQKTGLTLNNQFEIHLNKLGASSSWIVGAFIGDATKPNIAAGTGSLTERHPPSHARRLSGLANEPIATEFGKASLDLNRAPSKGHVIFLSVPQHTRLRCFVDGTLVADTLVTSTVLIKDGVVLDEPVSSLANVIIRLQFNKAVPPPPIARLPGGTYVVNRSVLRDNLLNSLEFPTLGQAACGCSRHAAFELKIGADGRVASVRKVSGDDDIAGAIQKVLGGWSFRPITDAGKPVEVKGLISLSVSRDGVIQILW